MYVGKEKKFSCRGKIFQVKSACTPQCYKDAYVQFKYHKKAKLCSSCSVKHSNMISVRHVLVLFDTTDCLLCLFLRVSQARDLLPSLDRMKANKRTKRWIHLNRCPQTLHQYFILYPRFPWKASLFLSGLCALVLSKVLILQLGAAIWTALSSSPTEVEMVSARGKEQ